MHSLKPIILLFLCAVIFSLQGKGQDTVFVYYLELGAVKDIAKCYTNQFDKEERLLVIGIEDTLSMLDELSLIEDRLQGPDCFVPQVKLVFRDISYVISLYCTTVLKYQNAKAFEPSAKLLGSDVSITPTIYAYLNSLKKKFYGEIEPNQQFLDQLTTSEPFEILPQDADDLDMLIEEEMLDKEETPQLNTKGKILPTEENWDEEEGPRKPAARRNTKKKKKQDQE